MVCINPFVFFYLGVTLRLAYGRDTDVAFEGRSPEINADPFREDIVGVNPKEMEAKNTAIDFSLRWPNGILHYSIGDGFSDRELEALDEVFSMFEASSCITFVKRTVEEFYVSIQKTGDGCYSYTGRQQRHLQPQIISLDAECFLCTATECKTWRLIHEFLGALGLTRGKSMNHADHVSMNNTNIAPDGSLVYNEAPASAANPHLPTIAVRDDDSVGERDSLSKLHLLNLNKLYGCSLTRELGEPAVLPGSGREGGSGRRKQNRLPKDAKQSEKEKKKQDRKRKKEEAAQKKKEAAREKKEAARKKKEAARKKKEKKKHEETPKKIPRIQQAKRIILSVFRKLKFRYRGS